MEGLKPLDDKIGGVIENFGCACNSNTSFSDNNLADYLTSFGTMYDESNESNLIENFKVNKEEFTSDDNIEDNDEQVFQWPHHHQAQPTAETCQCEYGHG